MTRRFTLRQINAVRMVTGLDGEADHIVPFAHGGATQVENCQMISREANRKKGARMIEFREWQQEFLRAWEDRQLSDFMLIAIPGGGKTIAALEVARRWIQSGRNRAVIVVVPSITLQEQWRDEAVQFGVELQTKEFGTSFKSGFHGGAATYAKIASEPTLFRTICSRYHTLVIMDEVHHCGDDMAYGDAVRHAFALAKEKLLMSGTPWKTCGTPIPFLNYDASGMVVGDFVYDYKAALAEKVIRNLVFDYSRGTVTNDSTGETLTVASESSEQEVSAALRRLLTPRGDFVREQIRQAHDRLMNIRQTIPDAAAMAACVDQQAAQAIAETIFEVTGCRPAVIVSDTDATTDTVKAFRNSRKEWLVAVRKVSEGTDIKRLQVLCYLTNTTAELFFRQLIGRVSRFRNQGDRQGYVFLPADPRLIEAAQNIEELQRLAKREQEDIEDEILERPRDPRLPLTCGSFTSAHDGADVLLAGTEIVPSEIAHIVRAAADAHGVTLQQALGIVRMTQAMEHTAPPQEIPAVSKEEAMGDLRRKCQRAANTLARLAGIEAADVHKRFKRQRDMSEQELRLKLSEIERDTAWRQEREEVKNGSR